MFDPGRAYRPGLSLHGEPGATHDDYCWLMRRVLDRPLPASHVPPGIRLEAFSLENAAEAYRLLTLGYQDQPENLPDYPAWRQAFESDPEFDIALCCIALDAHGMVGIVKCWTSAFIRDLVVHPRARHQGIGQCLLEHALRLFQQRGEGWVDLKVVENNHAARCLYEKAGMQYIRRLAVASG